MVEFVNAVRTYTFLQYALLAGVLATACARMRGRRRRACGIGLATVAWLCFWSWAPVYVWLGFRLEREYPPVPAAALPVADAIVVLGGGMEAPQAPLLYPEMKAAADRVWHAARLYQAGKAPVVIPSGVGEDEASVPFLRDLGVPAAAIRVERASRNTAENARFTAALLALMGGGRRVLLVTSAWHMRRAQLLFERAGVEVIPAATDYEATLMRARADHWSLPNLLPNPEMLYRNTCMLKEYIGYWVYRAVP